MSELGFLFLSHSVLFLFGVLNRGGTPSVLSPGRVTRLSPKSRNNSELSVNFDSVDDCTQTVMMTGPAVGSLMVGWGYFCSN